MVLRDYPGPYGKARGLRNGAAPKKLCRFEYLEMYPPPISWGATIHILQYVSGLLILK